MEVFSMVRKLDYRYAWLMLWLFALAGCQTANPIAAAETPEQRAFAAYGTFVILQETAADLAEDPAIPRGAKLRIIQAEERAKPVADSLLDAYTAFLIVKAEFDAGETSEQRFAIASKELNDWVTDLAPLMNELIRNIKGAQ
jgi:hypothetical protein